MDEKEIKPVDLIDTINGLDSIVRRQITTVLNNLELGLTITLACDAAGLSSSAFAKLRKIHPAIEQALKMAKAKFAWQQLVYLNAAAAIPDFWRAAQFLLQTTPDYKENNTKSQQLVTTSVNEIRQSLEDGIITVEEVVNQFPASIAALVIPAERYAEYNEKRTEDTALSLLNFANE